MWLLWQNACKVNFRSCYEIESKRMQGYFKILQEKSTSNREFFDIVTLEQGVTKRKH